ncbi:uncharacterized protein L199_000587 [Kwoniella botswanensis]|uniref:uncharacterized protein n=1 Tax=Kwoniella botswanensis TaxID=1268659 RepID=UPI00315C87C8
MESSRSGDRDSPREYLSLFDMFEQSCPTDHDQISSLERGNQNHQKAKLDVHIIPESDENCDTYRVQIYPSISHQDPAPTLPYSDPASISTTDESDLIMKRHKSLTAFAPYLSKSLRLIPSERIHCGSLSCFDHVTRCKAELRWYLPDSRNDSGCWKGMIKDDCKAITHFDCRWSKDNEADGDGDGDLPYDSGNLWNYDDPQDIIRISNLLQRQKVQSELSKSFTSIPISHVSGGGTGNICCKQEVMDLPKFEGIDWDRKKPREMTIKTVQTFSGSEMNVPRWIKTIKECSMDDDDIDRYVENLTNRQFIANVNKGDEELTEVLQWSNRLINSLPFRQHDEKEGEEKYERVHRLSEFELMCKTRPTPGNRSYENGYYSFEVRINQDQLR